MYSSIIDAMLALVGGLSVVLSAIWMFKDTSYVGSSHLEQPGTQSHPKTSSTVRQAA